MSGDDAGGGRRDGNDDDRPSKAPRRDQLSADADDEPIARTARQLLDDTRTFRSRLVEHRQSIHECLRITDSLQAILTEMHSNAVSRQAWLASESAALQQMREHWLQFAESHRASSGEGGSCSR